MVQNIPFIDMHCHAYPAKIAEKAVAHTNGFYGVEFNGQIGTPEELLSADEKAGIDLTLVCSVATTPHQVESINRFIAEMVAQSGGKLLGLGTLHPGCEDIPAEIDKMLKMGFRGVKLHPDIQRFALNDECGLRLLKACQGRLPVLVHGGDYRYSYSNPEQILDVLDACPDLTMVAAHFGCYSNWSRCEELFSAERLYVDSSSTFPFLRREMIEYLFRGFGTERVMFGTDYPMHFKNEVVDTFLSFDFNAEEKERMAHKNAEAVFHLPPL